MYIYIYMYVCMYVCMYVWMYGSAEKFKARLRMIGTTLRRLKATFTMIMLVRNLSSGSVRGLEAILSMIVGAQRGSKQYFE